MHSMLTGVNNQRRCSDAPSSVLDGLEIVLECRADKHVLSVEGYEGGAASFCHLLVQPGFLRLQATIGNKPLKGSPWSIQVAVLSFPLFSLSQQAHACCVRSPCTFMQAFQMTAGGR